MKVIIDYDPVTHKIETTDGTTWNIANIKYEEYKDQKLVAKMIDQGYTAKDLIELKETGVI